LEEFFAAWAPNMPDNNLSQCWLPKGCTPFYNTCGTAPGCGFQADGKTVLILPGPPKEMRAMMAHGGLDYLRAVSAEPIFSHNLHIFGMGESHVEEMLREEMNALQNPTLAPYAKEGEVRLRVTAKAESAEKAEEMMAPIIALCREKLGDFIYGVDIDSLENTVLRLLKEKGLTFAAAESCTGGLIAKRITDLPGSSAVFRGGCTVYTNDAKNILLGVPYELIEEKSVYSPEVAIALAENIRKTLGADFGIGVTGIAGPDGDGVHDVGTVFVALASPDGSFVRHLHLGARSDRSRIRTLSANYAFDMLRRALTGLEIEG
ncbi:MAG: nicotinamide-nucleotide amidohydrolase family protein, partial [Oscillospiraceae bacterium]|nr:nicotinamide-nucleotide amidohydrolase family protein [Oscillospiraceae bacterium]